MSKIAKASCVKRLNRIEGQVPGLARMIEENRYCIDIITQVSAVPSALSRVAEAVLREHVQHRVRHAMTRGNKTNQARIEELMAVPARARS